MKTKLTILLILISFCGFSQIKDVNYIFGMNNLGTVVVKNTHIHIEMNILLHYYNKYKKELYNDTIRVHTYNTGMSFYTCYKQIGNMESGYSFKLICTNPDHFEWQLRKQPNGLDVDFMNWINKQ